MPRVHLILDGLQDPRHARELSARWSAAGLDNAVDPTGQCGWISLGNRAPGEPARGLTPEELERAMAIARAFGIEPRDLVMEAVEDGEAPAALRERVLTEYRRALGQALAFGLPLLVLHAMAPILASGDRAAGLVYPWLIEAALGTWVLRVTAWSLIWQGALALLHLRMTADLYFLTVALVAWGGSMLGMGALVAGGEPWFGDSGPLFHAAGAAACLAALQRYLAHRLAPRLRGRAHLLIPVCSTALSAWLGFAAGVAWLWGLRDGVAFALLLPPLCSLACVSARTPGAAAMLPVPAFAALLFLGDGWMASMGLKLEGSRVAAAMAFATLMTIAMGLGWRAWPRRGGLEKRKT